MSHNLSREPGADELRVRQLLIRNGVGPDAGTAPVPPPRKGSPRLPHWWAPKPDVDADGIIPEPAPQEPTGRPKDWLDDILDDDTPPAPAKTPDPQPEPMPPEPRPEPGTAQPAQTPAKPPRRRPTLHAGRQSDSPRMSLLDAWDRTPRRIRWLAYHATAAAAGWRLGWVDWATDTAAWYADGHWAAPSAFVLYGIGAVALGLYRRSRTWAWAAAWAAAVPVSSIVAGIALYGTGYPS